MGEDTAFLASCKSQMLQLQDAGETTHDQGPQQVQEQQGGLSQLGHHHSKQGKPLDDGQQTRDGDALKHILM